MKKLVFEPYPVKVGDRIYLTAGPWKGDWEVIDVTEKTIKVKCPVKGTELEWKRLLAYYRGEEEIATQK